VPNKLFRVMFAPFHCLEPHVVQGDLTADEARDLIRRLNRRARKRRHDVTKVEKGVWEHSAPDDCAMIPDSAGYLMLRPER
jgi:hypothetical protein